MIRDRFAVPFAVDESPTAPIEMPNQGVRDEGAMEGVPALPMVGGPAMASTERQGKLHVGVLDLSECPKPVAGRPETCSTPGTWTPDTCSLGSHADVTADHWCMLAPGTWCPDTPIPDVAQQITSREVNRSGAATIPTPVHVIASVCVRISGRVVFTKPRQVLSAVVPSNFFPLTEACVWCAQIGKRCTFLHHLGHSKVGKCDDCIASGRECLFRRPVTHPLAVALSATCTNCQTVHKACKHTFRGAKLPACFRCLDRALGHVCFYKPVTQGGHSSKACGRILTPPESSRETSVSKQSRPCHATPSQVPWIRADPVLNYIFDLSAPKQPPNRYANLRTLLCRRGGALLSFAQSASPASNMFPPDYLARDNNLISLLSDGCLPKFSEDVWDHFLREWEKTIFSFVPGFKAFRILVSGHESMYHYCLDSIMTRTGFDGVIVHTEHQVLTAVLSPEACSQCHETICRRIKVDTCPNELVLAGVRKLSQRDNNHRHRDIAAEALKCANYGCSLRGQKPNFGANRVVTGSRGVSVSTGAPETMLASLFSSFYHENCLAVFTKQHLALDDQYYPGHLPRVAKDYSRTRVKKIDYLIYGLRRATS